MPKILIRKPVSLHARLRSLYWTSLGSLILFLIFVGVFWMGPRGINAGWVSRTAHFIATSEGLVTRVARPDDPDWQDAESGWESIKYSQHPQKWLAPMWAKISYSAETDRVRMQEQAKYESSSAPAVGGWFNTATPTLPSRLSMIVPGLLIDEAWRIANGASVGESRSGLLWIGIAYNIIFVVVLLSGLFYLIRFLRVGISLARWPGPDQFCCPKCRFSLDGLHRAEICPECGMELKWKS